MDVDTLGRGPGGKRGVNLVDKLSAGEAASEVLIQRTLDELLDHAGDRREWSGQVAYESLSLLCDGTGPVGCAAFAESDGFVEKLSLRLQQDLTRILKAGSTVNGMKNTDAAVDLGRSAVQLVSRLPDGALCKLLGTRETTLVLQGFVAEHSVASLRAFSISRLAAACTKCWSFLDRHPFVNGAFEQGSDAQRFKQRVRDWIHDFFASVVKFCEDPSDAVAGAAFDAIHAALRGHPLCVTWVDEELRDFWGLEERRWRRREVVIVEDDQRWKGDFGAHKQAFPLQQLGEIVLRFALPRIRGLLRRQSRMLPPYETPAATSAVAAAAATRACTSLLVAALRLSTSPSGKPVRHPLLEDSMSGGFFGARGFGDASSGGGEGEGESFGKGTPRELVGEWVEIRLRAVIEDTEGRDALLVEAAAWATLRVLRTEEMAPLKASTAPRVAEAFLRVLQVAQKTSSTKLSFPPSFHAGQQETTAGAAMALLISPPSATAALAPHVVAAAEWVPQPRRRLALLADVFFALLVRAARGGRAPRSVSSGNGGGGGGTNATHRRRRLKDVAVGSRGAWLLLSVLEEDWFAQLVSESAPEGTRRLVFREEVVAALATACAQVLAAGALSVLSPVSQKAAAVGIGTLASRPTPRLDHRDGSASTPIEAAAAAAAAAGTAPPFGSESEGQGAAAAADRERWTDLETWLDCSLSALESCTRCLNWASSGYGYVAGLAYVRLFSMALRLLCPVARGDNNARDLEGERGAGAGAALDDGEEEGREGPRGGGRLRWARERLAHVVDDLMWRLREGLPGRDIRLRLLQATCSHVRLLAVVGRNDRAAEDTAMELVSVLQGELGELDAQAGLASSSQPARAPTATVGGESAAESGSVDRARDDARAGSNASAAAETSEADDETNAGCSGDEYGSSVVDSVAPAASAATVAGGGGAAATVARAEHGGANLNVVPSGRQSSSSSSASKSGSMTDVAAHEVVVGCLVRLALVAGEETALEVVSVLGREKGRARARERLGHGAIGPMEEAVAKGVYAVESLVFRRDGDKSASLLRIFLATMDLGWQAAVQPDERALTGIEAGTFDHGAHAYSFIHRRLRRRLCGGVGACDSVLPASPPAGTSSDAPSSCSSPESRMFDTPDWAEEAPHSQLNGGSDPVVVTATHVVDHGRDGGGTGATLRLKVFNATNARLQGFSVRLSFGQGGEAAGMAAWGGRVERVVNEVLMPSAAHALEVPIAPVDGLRDVVVHVTVVFPDAEPEPEFESEGTAELLGIEVGHKGDGYRDNSRFGSSQKYLDGTSFGGDGGGDEDGGRSVPVVLHAGSYRLPAEAFLGPPKPFTTAWAGFQTVWSGLPYAHAFPVESRRGRGSDGSGACGSRAAMAAVACPRGNTDYAVSEAWAFEAWDGTPVLCTLTAMKAPFSFGAPTAGGYSPIWGGAGGIVSWFGRMEMRCGSYACLEFAQMSPDRLARFVTGGVFLPRMVESQQQQQQLDSFGRGTDKVNSDWFSRTDISAPEPLAQQSSSALSSTFREDAAATKGRIAALVRALREREYVDTTRAA